MDVFRLYECNIGIKQFADGNRLQQSNMLARSVNFDRAMGDLDRVTHHKSLLSGDKLFRLGEESMELYLIESGSINLRVRGIKMRFG